MPRWALYLVIKPREEDTVCVSKPLYGKDVYSIHSCLPFFSGRGTTSSGGTSSFCNECKPQHQRLASALTRFAAAKLTYQLCTFVSFLLILALADPAFATRDDYCRTTSSPQGCPFCNAKVPIPDGCRVR